MTTLDPSVAAPRTQAHGALPQEETVQKRTQDDLPKTWGESVQAWLKPPRKLKFTQIGKYFTGMTILIGFGAINTGNNLLYLLLGMMLALIILSGILSESVIKSLAIQRTFPSRIFAGRPATIAIQVENLKPRIPSLSIQILDRFSALDADDRPAVYFMRLRPQETLSSSYRFTFPRRGVWKTQGFEIATRFPFDLFLKSRDQNGESELIVYPHILPSPNIHELHQLPQGDTPQRNAGHGLEFHGIRDYRPGDDARSVHWKLSARREQPVVREYEREEARAVTLCLYNVWDWSQCDDTDLDAIALYRDHLEYTVGLTAGLAQDLIGRNFSVGLALCGHTLSQGSGSVQLHRILHTLALMTFHGQPDDEAITRQRERLKKRHSKLLRPVSLKPDDVGAPPPAFDLGPTDRAVLIGHAPSLDAVSLPHTLKRIACTSTLSETLGVQPKRKTA